MRVIIEGIKYKVDERVKDEAMKATYYGLRKDGEDRNHLLVIYDNKNFKLFKPLGNFLPVPEQELKEIAFSLEKEDFNV